MNVVEDGAPLLGHGGNNHFGNAEAEVDAGDEEDHRRCIPRHRCIIEGDKYVEDDQKWWNESLNSFEQRLLRLN